MYHLDIACTSSSVPVVVSIETEKTVLNLILMGGFKQHGSQAYNLEWFQKVCKAFQILAPFKQKIGGLQVSVQLKKYTLINLNLSILNVT